jgi:uncharacterized membrane protein
MRGLLAGLRSLIKTSENAVLKTLIVGIVAVCSWMFVAPKIWPAHPSIATIIIVVVVGFLVEMVWPEPNDKSTK